MSSRSKTFDSVVQTQATTNSQRYKIQVKRAHRVNHDLKCTQTERTGAECTKHSSKVVPQAAVRSRSRSSREKQAPSTPESTPSPNRRQNNSRIDSSRGEVTLENGTRSKKSSSQLSTTTSPLANVDQTKGSRRQENKSSQGTTRASFFADAAKVMAIPSQSSAIIVLSAEDKVRRASTSMNAKPTPQIQKGTASFASIYSAKHGGSNGKFSITTMPLEQTRRMSRRVTVTSSGETNLRDSLKSSLTSVKSAPMPYSNRSSESNLRNEVMRGRECRRVSFSATLDMIFIPPRQAVAQKSENAVTKALARRVAPQPVRGVVSLTKQVTRMSEFGKEKNHNDGDLSILAVKSLDPQLNALLHDPPSEIIPNGTVKGCNDTSVLDGRRSSRYRSTDDEATSQTQKTDFTESSKKQSPVQLDALLQRKSSKVIVPYINSNNTGGHYRRSSSHPPSAIVDDFFAEKFMDTFNNGESSARQESKGFNANKESSKLTKEKLSCLDAKSEEIMDRLFKCKQSKLKPSCGTLILPPPPRPYDTKGINSTEGTIRSSASDSDDFTLVTMDSSIILSQRSAHKKRFNKHESAQANATKPMYNRSFSADSANCKFIPRQASPPDLKALALNRNFPPPPPPRDKQQRM